MELNHTCLELLKILYEQKDYINIGILADRIGKTERSVRYSLDRIDEFLIRKKLPFLSRKFGTGIYLERTPETEAVLEKFLASSTPYQYKYSAEERERFLEICLLVGRSHYIPVAELAEQLTVSYGTIAADLELVEKRFRQVLNDPQSPILQIVRKDRLEGLITEDYTWPWYGQLMKAPQTLAYMLQVNFWMSHYRVKLR